MSSGRAKLGFGVSTRAVILSFLSSFRHALPCLCAIIALHAPPARAQGPAVTPGIEACFTNALPEGYGAFLLVKNALWTQSPGNPPAVAPDPSALGVIQFQEPTAYAVSNISVSGPGGFRAPLSPLSDNFFQWTQSYATESNLNATLQAGLWSASFDGAFTNDEAFVGFFPFVVGTGEPPVPELSNLENLQSVAPGAATTVSWLPWMGASTNDRVSLVLVNASGVPVFSASTDCAGQVQLPAGATSVEIPAGTLPGGQNLAGYLTFSTPLTAEQDDGTLVVERAFQARTTQFSMRTTGGGGGGELGEISEPTLSGTNLVFVLNGDPGVTYSIQETTNLVDWIELSSVTLPASGVTNISIPLPSDGRPRFYRAVSQGGSSEPGDAADLGIVQTGPGQLSIVVTGTSGATYRLEASTNYVAWTELQEVTIPMNTNSVAAPVTVPAGVNFIVFRAVGLSGGTPEPPTGDGPQLALARAGAGLQLSLTGGQPNQVYVVQTANAAFTNWTDTATTVTANASGEGEAAIPVPAGQAAGFFRVLAK